MYSDYGDREEVNIGGYVGVQQRGCFGGEVLALKDEEVDKFKGFVIFQSLKEIKALVKDLIEDVDAEQVIINGIRAKWNQETWGERSMFYDKNGYHIEFDEIPKNMCNTDACLAGFAFMHYWPKVFHNALEKHSSFSTVNGMLAGFTDDRGKLNHKDNKIGIEHVAQALLGLTAEQAYVLFHHGNEHDFVLRVLNKFLETGNWEHLD